MLLIIINTIVATARFFYLNQVIDYSFNNDDRWIESIYWLLGITVAQVALAFGQAYYKQALTIKFSFYLREMMLEENFVIDRWGVYEKKGTYQSKMISNVEDIVIDGLINLFQFISWVLQFVFFSGLLLYYNIWLFVIAVGMSAVLFIAGFITIKPISMRWREYIRIENEYASEANFLLDERHNFYLLKKMNIFNKLSLKLVKFKNLKKYTAWKKMIYLFIPLLVIGNLAGSALAPISVSLLTFLKVLNDISLIGIVTIILGRMAGVASNIPEAIRDIMNRQKLLSDLTKSVKTTEINTAKKIQIANFNPRINDSLLYSKPLNLVFKSGDKVLLEGPNGIGKSLLVAAIQGRFQSYDGQIKINNQLQDGTLFSKGMIFVGEKNHVFNATVRSNITLYSSQISDREVMRAMRKVNLDLKLDQEISAETISDGQKQKIAIARVFLKKPDLCFLDESLKNVSKEDTKIITDNLKALPSGVFWISHKDESNEFQKIKIK